MTEPNPYLDLLDDKPDPGAAAQREPTPIDGTQRFILQNFFDTQPKRRAARLEKLGWEMGPDHNKIRPLGDPTPWPLVKQKIDPGLEVLDVNAVRKDANYLKKIAYETGKDVGDIISDAVNGTLSMTGGLEGAALGGTAGAALGTLAGPGLGTIIGGTGGTILGAVLGGALGEASGEGLKKVIGDEFFLSKDVPMEMELLYTQAALSGAFSMLDVPLARKAIRGGAAGIKEFMANGIKASGENLRRAVEQAGGMTPEILQRYMANPREFSEEATKGAIQQSREKFREIYGLPEEKFTPTKNPNRVLPDSNFGKRLNPLRQEGELETARLIADPQAKITYGDYIDQLTPEIDSLHSRRLKGEESEALGIFEGEINDLAKQAGIESHHYRGTVKGDKKTTAEIVKELRTKEMPFDKFINNIEVLQDKAFSEKPDLAGRYTENPLVADVAGKLRRLRDTVSDASYLRRVNAGEVGTRPLSTIKAEQHKILDTYNRAAPTLKDPQSIRRAILNPIDEKSADVMDAVVELDDVLGTQYKNFFDKNATQVAIERVRQNRSAFGSGRALTAGLQGAYEGGKSGLTLGLPALAKGTGVGLPVMAVTGTIGAVRGAAKGAAMASPERALSAISENFAKEQLLRDSASALRQAGGEAFGTVGNVIKGATQLGGEAVGRDVIENMSDVDEENPYVKLLE